MELLGESHPRVAYGHAQDAGFLSHHIWTPRRQFVPLDGDDGTASLEYSIHGHT